ncbi:MAG: type II toxin-antitoxin system HicA family toxin [Burkholderiales bacterium]|nr:type II toxin-antitoxin system HicA family toxin [Burkholderiales bacterium]
MVTEGGCWFVKPGCGDHEHGFRPLSSRQFIVDGCILSRHTANETLQQAGVPKKF